MGKTTSTCAVCSNKFVAKSGNKNHICGKCTFWSHANGVHLGTDACWLWSGKISSLGYGVSSIRSIAGIKRGLAHRIAWTLTVGPIPDGIILCHNCDVSYPVGDISYRRCINPWHMRPGSHLENSTDCICKGRKNLSRGTDHWSATNRDKFMRTVYDKMARAPRVVGEAHGMTCLTEDDVARIRTTRASQSELASIFNVSQSTISNIINRKTWGHV